MPRQRSPCSPSQRRIPKYKVLARDLPSQAKETLERVRYQEQQPGRPCRRVTDDTPGRTTCYAPTQHSRRRKTCNLLVDPNHDVPNVTPDLHLWGVDEMKDVRLLCRAYNILMGDVRNVDTAQTPPPPYTIAVLGPYVHPVTERLVIKCILVDVFEDVRNVNDLGMAFSEVTMSERGVMVPTLDMLHRFINRLASVPGTRNELIVENLRFIERRLYQIHAPIQDLTFECMKDPIFLQQVRTILRCFYEMALYFRRWGGPGRKVPLLLLQGVGTGNPISAKLTGKYVRSTMTGPRLVKSADDSPADFVMQPEGTLTNMSQAHAQSIYMIYTSMSLQRQRILRSAFQLGTPFRTVEGGFWMDDIDVYTDGNPASVPLNLFNMCFGTRGSQHLYAEVSLFGTRTYCVQVASIQIIRSVQTILPLVYRSRPNWAAVDGEFDHVHT